MAIRVQNADNIFFGVMVAARVVTHVRIHKQGRPNAEAIVRPLTAAVNVGAGERLRLPDGDGDLVFPSGHVGNTVMRQIVDGYFEGETFELDMQTDANTVINDAGYAQQTRDNLAISEEAD